MLRAVLAVVAGYVVMAAVVFITFSGLYLALGTERTFRPGSYDVSAAWAVGSVVLSVVAAVVGGLVCAAISRGGRAPMALAAAVFVLGVLSAIPALTDSRPREARTGDVSNTAAMMNARQPVWFALAMPVVGAVGVMVGAGMYGRKKRG